MALFRSADGGPRRRAPVTPVSPLRPATAPAEEGHSDRTTSATGARRCHWTGARSSATALAVGGGSTRASRMGGTSRRGRSLSGWWSGRLFSGGGCTSGDWGRSSVPTDDPERFDDLLGAPGSTAVRRVEHSAGSGAGRAGSPDRPRRADPPGATGRSDRPVWPDPGGRPQGAGSGYRSDPMSSEARGGRVGVRSWGAPLRARAGVQLPVGGPGPRRRASVDGWGGASAGRARGRRARTRCQALEARLISSWPRTVPKVPGTAQRVSPEPDRAFSASPPAGPAGHQNPAARRGSGLRARRSCR